MAIPFTDAHKAMAIQIICYSGGSVQLGGAEYYPDGREEDPDPKLVALFRSPKEIQEAARASQAASIAQQAASAARQAVLPLPARVHEARYQHTVLLLLAFLKHALNAFSENAIIALVLNYSNIKKVYDGPFISRLKQEVKDHYGKTFGEALSFGLYKPRREPCPERSPACEFDYWSDAYHGCSCCKGLKYVLSNSQYDAQGRVVVCWSTSPSAMASLQKVFHNGRGLDGRMGVEVAHYDSPDFTRPETIAWMRPETIAWMTQQGGTTQSFKMVGPPPVCEETKLVEAYSLCGDRLLSHHFRTDQPVQRVLQVFGELCELHLGYAAGKFKITASDSNGGGVRSYLKVGNVSGLVCSIICE